ncbi:hypothetical protein BDW68DRAFT_169752 [Aspergillus falconensis]
MVGGCGILWLRKVGCHNLSRVSFQEAGCAMAVGSDSGPYVAEASHLVVCVDCSKSRTRFDKLLKSSRVKGRSTAELITAAALPPSLMHDIMAVTNTGGGDRWFMVQNQLLSCRLQNSRGRGVPPSRARKSSALTPWPNKSDYWFRASARVESTERYSRGDPVRG